jgi:hypothetical protein
MSALSDRLARGYRRPGFCARTGRSGSRCDRTRACRLAAAATGRTRWCRSDSATTGRHPRLRHPVHTRPLRQVRIRRRRLQGRHPPPRHRPRTACSKPTWTTTAAAWARPSSPTRRRRAARSARRQRAAPTGCGCSTGSCPSATSRAGRQSPSHALVDIAASPRHRVVSSEVSNGACSLAAPRRRSTRSLRLALDVQVIMTPPYTIH